MNDHCLVPITSASSKRSAIDCIRLTAEGTEHQNTLITNSLLIQRCNHPHARQQHILLLQDKKSLLHC